MKRPFTAPVIALSLSALATAAFAQGPESRAVEAESIPNETVYEYALKHPVPEADLAITPSLGESIPMTVTLTKPDKSEFYAYFYYAGQPVIVEMVTRSVVRIGQ